nr:hypothetical protein [Tanacetum cinerariifolium]
MYSRAELAVLRLQGSTERSVLIRVSLDFCSKEKMSRDVLTVGSTMRIPLFYRGEYSQWIESNKTAKDLWDALARYMLGSEYGEQDRKAAVLYECEIFKAIEGEFDADDFSELKKITALLAKAFNRIKFYSKPTNNNFRTSSTSQSANKKQEFDKKVEKKDEKKRDMSKVKCYNCKKEGHFEKDCKKVKVKDYEYYKTKMLLEKKDKDEHVLLAEDQAWMESSNDSDLEINANMVSMAQIKKVLSDSKTSSSFADDKIFEVSYYLSESESEYKYETSEYYDNTTTYAIDHNDSKGIDKLIRKFNKKIAKCLKRIEKANQKNKDFENENKDLQDKFDVLKNQATTFEMNNKELNEQFKVLIEKNGFENPSYFEKAKDLRPSLYDEKVIGLGYTPMFLTHSDEALEIEKFKRARENKIEFAYDYGNLNASYQTSSLKPYVSTVILENIIIYLEDEVVSLLKKEKSNLETIDSLKSKSFESSENAISESENQSENDCQVVEKECDKMKNSEVITPGMFKLSVLLGIVIPAARVFCFCWQVFIPAGNNDGNLKICPPVTAKEHQQVQREEKARTILLFALPDEHMGEFYHMIDARDIWNAIKIDTKGYSSNSSTLSNAAFVSTAGSSQGNLSYQESRNGGHITTHSVSPGSSSSKGSLKSKCSVVDDVIYFFFTNHKIDQHLVYEDLDQMNKEEFKEYDLKHQMAMLSIKVHRFEKKHGQKIKFNGRENARFDKKLVKCFNCKQMGHFSKECRAQGGQNSNNYRKYKSKEAGKDGSDSKAMVVVDGSINWDKQTDEGNTEPRSLENFGMIAGIKIESDADSEGEVVSADNAIPAGVSISTGNVAAVVPETEFALMGLSTEAAQEKQELTTKLDNEIANQAKWNNSGKNLYKLIDSSMSVRTKRGLGLDKYIGEGELGIDDSQFSIFHTNSDDLKGQPIYNRFASVDHMKAVPPPLTGNYMPPSNIPDIDESQMVYGKKATDSSEIKSNDDSISHSNDPVYFDFSDRSSEPSTNDLQTCDSSVECSRPNHSDRDSTDYISSVSAPASESGDTVVIDCDKQEDFPSICSIETDVKSSKPLCNKFGSFNKESHFRKHKSVASKSCYVCGSYFHLIKDCDFHEQRFAKRNAEGKGKLGKRPTGKQVNPNRPKPVSAGQPNLVSAGQPNPISAGQLNPVTAGQPNPVSAGDGILGP